MITNRCNLPEVVILLPRYKNSIERNGMRKLEKISLKWAQIIRYGSINITYTFKEFMGFRARL